MHEEKFDSIKNLDRDTRADELLNHLKVDILKDYQIKLSNKYDHTEIKYNHFSRNNLRDLIYHKINEIGHNWNKESYINEAIRETNAYQEVFENFFQNNSSIRVIL